MYQTKRQAQQGTKKEESTEFLCEKGLAAEAGERVKVGTEENPVCMGGLYLHVLQGCACMCVCTHVCTYV